MYSKATVLAAIITFAMGGGGLKAAPSAAEMLDGLSSIQFGSDIGFALGDTLAITSPASPLQRCMDYDQTNDVKSDTSGAVSSSLNVYLIKTLDDLERNTNFSFATSASMGFDLGTAFGAKGESKQNGRFEQFVHAERQSLLLVIEASADQGREYISDFKLRQNFSDLLSAGKVKDFIAMCGTHFIRGVSKRSGLRLIITITNLTDSSKRLISYHFETSGSANASLSGFSANAKASLSTDISDTLKLATNFGKLTYDVQATGGLGINTLGKTLKAADLSNLSDFRKVMDAMADATQDFSRTNAAPDKFIIVPHPQLKPADVKFDPKRYEVLGRIYKSLLRINQQADLYEGYKRANYTLWDKYFRVQTEKVSTLRNQLLRQYAACRDQGQCDADIPEVIDGLILSDLTYNGKLRATCPLGDNNQQLLNSKSVSRADYLSMVAVDWTGQIRFLSDIDINGTEFYRITPTLRLERLPIDVKKQVTVQSDARKPDEARAFFSLAFLETDPSKVIAGGSVDLNYLSDFRRDAARSVYFIRMPLLAGFQVEEVLGFPDMRGCRIVDENID